MKKVIITNKFGQSYSAEMPNLTELTEWIDNQKLINSWGKPERWIRERIVDNDSYVYPDETYIEDDVIDNKTENQIKYVKIKAEYTINILPFDFDAAKIKKIAEIDLKFNDARQNYRGMVTVNGIQWDSGRVYLTNIESAIKEFIKGSITGTVTWRDYNNIDHSMNQSQLEAIRDAIETNLFLTGSALYQLKWNLKEALMDLTLEEEFEDLIIDFVNYQ